MPTEPELKAKISLDGSSWEAGMKQVSGGLKKLGGEFAGIKNLIAGAFTLTAIIDQTKAIVDYGSKIHDLSTRTGISTDALQEFDYAAKQTGSSLDAFVGALRRMTVSQVNAAKADGDLREGFQALGVSLSDLQSKNPEQLFRQIAEKIRTSDLNANQLAAIIQVMGRSADEILPAMKEGFTDMADEAHKIGAVLEEDVINKLDEAGDAMVRAGAKMKPVWANIATGAANAVVWLQRMVQLTGLGGVAAYAKLTGNKELFQAAQEEIQGIANPAEESPKSTKKGALPIDFDQLKTKSASAKHERSISQELEVNSLQKIGAFVGGPDRLVNLAERQLGTLMRIEQNTKPQGGLGGGVVFPT